MANPIELTHPEWLRVKELTSLETRSGCFHLIEFPIVYSCVKPGSVPRENGTAADEAPLNPAPELAVVRDLTLCSGTSQVPQRLKGTKVRFGTTLMSSSARKELREYPIGVL